MSSNVIAKAWSARFRNTLVAFICTTLFASFAFATPIRVLVLDAHSGRSIKGTDVSIAIMGRKGAFSYTTDSCEIIVFDVNPADKLIPSTGWRVTCRKINSTAPHWFSASAIIEHGEVDENTCGKAHLVPIRDTLVIFTRKSTLFREYGSLMNC